MNRAPWLCALVATLATLAPRPASAFCGFYVSGAGESIFNDATQVVMMRFGTLTVLSMQNAYKGPPEDFAMVVPVPVVLQEENVKTLDNAAFTTVDTLAAPRLVEYWEQNPCPMPMADYEMADEAMAPRAPTKSTGSSRDLDLGVTVEAQFKVGEYEVVILSARESTGLDSWLRQEKYAIPDGAETYLRPYVESGSKFFVARVDVSKVAFRDGRALLSPLRFHYESDSFSLPIRLGLMNSAGAQDLIVHILAPNQRYEVANYKNVTIPTNLVVEDAVREDFGAFYNALFDYTVEQNPGAVVTEYSWPSWPGKCDPCPGTVQGIDQNTLSLLGGDLLGQVVAGVDMIALEEQMQEVQRAYSETQRSGAVTPDQQRQYQQLTQRYYRASSQIQQVMNSFVLTRLHARYDKGTVGEDLVFMPAPPIIGGRGMPSPTGELEERTQPSNVNQFQGRYVILHRWDGEVACPNPSFGRWGGPPGGAMRGPISPPPSSQLAIAARGSARLDTLLAAMPDFEYVSNAKMGAVAETPPPARGDRGCGCRASAGSAGSVVLLVLVGLFGLRRRGRL